MNDLLRLVFFGVMDFILVGGYNSVCVYARIEQILKLVKLWKTEEHRLVLDPMKSFFFFGGAKPFSSRHDENLFLLFSDQTLWVDSLAAFMLEFY